MAQSSPNWIMIFLGGSGLLGLITLVTKGIVDQKEEQIKYLNKKNHDLEADLRAEKEKSRRLVDDFLERLKNIDAGRLSSEDAVRLKEIFSILGDFENLQTEFDDCKQAAEWLLTRQKIWVQQACSYAHQKYRKLLPRDKVKFFRKDIEQYLTWVYTCLHDYGHTLNTPLADFVKSPVIRSHHPYVAAINHLIEQGDWGELTPDQRAFLQEVLTQLAEKIRDEF